jgi:hypothetical protein
LEQTHDGGFIIAGFSTSSDGDVTKHHGSTNSGDYWIVKIDVNGNIQWEKSLGGSGDDEAASIKQTNDGGYIVCGTSYSTDGDVTGNHGGADYWVIKLDSIGTIQWEKSLGGSGDDFGVSVYQTNDTGYIVAGCSHSNDGNVTGHHSQLDSLDYWIVKLNSTGNIQWEKSLGGNGNDYAGSICQTGDGGYIVSGWSNSNDGDVTGNHGGYDIWVVKLDGSGTIQWEKCYGGSLAETSGNIRQTNDGGYILAGSTGSNDGDVTGNHGPGDYWVVKLNDTGTIQWENCYGGSKDEPYVWLDQAKDGGYFLNGTSESNDGEVTGHRGINNNNYWAVRIDSVGKIEWEESLGGTRDNEGYTSFCAKDGSFLVSGISSSTDNGVTGNHGATDYWIVKLGFISPIISSVTSLNFDSLMCYRSKQDSLWVHNTGDTTLIITADSILGHWIGGQNSNAFTLVSPAAFPVTIAPGDSLRFIILFDPTSQPKVTPYTDTLSLISNDTLPGHNPWIVQLKSVADTENFILDLYVTEYGWDRNSDTLDLGTVPCGTAKDTSFPLTYYPPLPTSYRIKTPDPAFTVPSSIYFDSFHANHQAPVPLMVRFIASNGPGRYVAPVFFTDTCGHTDSAYFLVTITGAVVTVAAPPDTTICAGDSVLLTASGSFSSYQWSDGETTQSIIVKASGTYSVTATNPNGCSANSAPVRVTVNNVVAPVINGVSGICPGGSTTLDAGSGYASYLWSTGETTQAVTVTVPGTYSVMVTQGNCSVTSADFTVVQYPAPTVTITLSGDTLVSTPAVTYQWYLNGAAIPGATSQTYIPFMEGSYTVAVTDTNGCTGTSPAYLQGALSVELCSASPAPVLPAVLIDLPVSLSETITAPVDSVAFDVAYNRVALFYLTATSPRCGLRVERVNSGDLHITAFSCGTPLSAGDIADVKFVGLVTSSDTTYTQVNINNVTFYPAGTVTGSGCSVPVTINPYCGLHGVYYTGATSLAQNYPNPFTGTTTIHVTLAQTDANGAQLKVYNMLGEQVADLTGQLAPNADISFNAEENKAGVYYYTLQTASGRFTRQMFVVK